MTRRDRVRRGLRFTPPRVPPSPGEAWALRRAFGPIGAAPGPPPDPALAVEAAKALDLAARIGGRWGRGKLEAELGPDAAAALVAQTRAAVALDIALRNVAADVAAASGGLGLPVAFLKGTGLSLSGAVPPGFRRACDVDALAPPDGVDSLCRALEERGCEPTGLPEHEHQASPLRHPSGVLVEVHRLVLGVRLRPGRSADLATLSAAGELSPAADLPSNAFVPSPRILLAHAVVHGIAQHGLTPASYPLFRMVADLVDLGAPGMEDLGTLQRWVAAEVSPEELGAALELADRLGGGDLPAPGDGGWDEPALVLLRHLLAGGADESYRRSLRLRSILDAPTDRSRLGAAVDAAWKAVAVGEVEVDILYGPQRSRWGYRLWKAVRPFHLLGRLAGHAMRARRGPACR